MLNIGVYQALNMLCTEYMNMYENTSYCPAYLVFNYIHYNYNILGS